MSEEASSMAAKERFPLASVQAIEFGLASSKDIKKVSVFKSEGVTQPSMLSSTLLGLPTRNENGQCATCGVDEVFHCDGHFGHIQLPIPIYHPSYVRLVKEILDKICLNCLQPKKRKNEPSLSNFDGICNGYGKGTASCSKSNGITENVMDTLTLINLKEEYAESTSPCYMVDNGGVSLIKGNRDKTGKMTSALDGLPQVSGKSMFETKGSSTSVKTKARKGKSVTTDCKGKTSKVRGKRLDCEYCGTNNIYPAIEVTIPGKADGTKLIELKMSSMKDLIPGYWDFLKKFLGYTTHEGFSTRTLLPYEARKLLKEIPDKTLRKIGIDPSIAVPDALILSSVPVTPNCIRIPEPEGQSIKFTDYRNYFLRKLMTSIRTINQSRQQKLKFEVHKSGVKELQTLFARYLEVMGGLKVPGTIDASFRVWGKASADVSFSNLWLDKIRSLFISKSCGLSSRSIVIGDAYIGIDEIGIPIEVAKKVSFEERATEFNKELLQSIVDRRQCQIVAGKTGKFVAEAMPSVKAIEVGELVNRNLQDGDVVFINRPPSIHKHSLLGLRVFLHPGQAVVINPLICAPLGGDFDGDALHVFYPKSVESKAELSELLCVDKQIFSSHSGDWNFPLTVDTLLGIKDLFASFFIDKATIDQLALWILGKLPEPAIVRCCNDGLKVPIWTANQLLEMIIPSNISIETQNVLIREGQLMIFNCDKQKLQSSVVEILMIVAQQEGSEFALKCLHSIECFLIEWLSCKGFSVGLEDLTIGDSSGKYPFTEEWKSELTELSKLMHHMGSGIYDNAILYQVERGLTELSDRMKSVLSCKNSVVSIIEGGSSKHANKLVQQLGFVGLQLFRGRNAIPRNWHERLFIYLPCDSSLSSEMYCEAETPEVYGMITSSFVSGLNPCESFVHSVSSRDVMLCQKMGLKEPGTLFKNLMAFLRDMTISYDGTVRNACGNFLIQFDYDHDENNLYSPGEPVGILAATAIAGPAYKALGEASQKGISPWEILEETLKRRSKGILQTRDRTVLIYMKDNYSIFGFDDKAKSHSESSLGLVGQITSQIQEAFEKIPLKTFSRAIFVEYQERRECSEMKSPFLAHIQLDINQLRQANLTPAMIEMALSESINKSSHPLYGFQDNFLLYACDFCNVSQKYDAYDMELPCLHFALRENQAVYPQSTEIVLSQLVDVLYPALLKTTVKGNNQIESISISSSSPSSKSWVPRISPSNCRKGDIVIEIIVENEEVGERGDAWRASLNSLLPFIDALDDTRCLPYSIHETYQLLGISAAYNLIVQRLSLALEMIGKGTFKKHLMLVAACMTFTGKVIGYNPAGYRELYKSLKYDVPFTESTLKTPIKCFERAVEDGAVDSLSGSVASCSWGKRAPLGTGSGFEILWKDEEAHNQKLFEQHKDIDINEMIETLGIKEEKHMSSPCLYADDKLQNNKCGLKCPDSFIYERTNGKASWEGNNNDWGPTGITQNREANGKSSWEGNNNEWGPTGITQNRESNWDSVVTESRDSGWGSTGITQNTEANWDSVVTESQVSGWGSTGITQDTEANWDSVVTESQVSGWGMADKNTKTCSEPENRITEEGNKLGEQNVALEGNNNAWDSTTTDNNEWNEPASQTDNGPSNTSMQFRSELQNESAEGQYYKRRKFNGSSGFKPTGANLVPLGNKGFSRAETEGIEGIEASNDWSGRVSMPGDSSNWCTDAGACSSWHSTDGNRGFKPTGANLVPVANKGISRAKAEDTEADQGSNDWSTRVSIPEDSCNWTSDVKNNEDDKGTCGYSSWNSSEGKTGTWDSSENKSGTWNSSEGKTGTWDSSENRSGTWNSSEDRAGPWNPSQGRGTARGRGRGGSRGRGGYVRGRSNKQFTLCPRSDTPVAGEDSILSEIECKMHSMRSILNDNRYAEGTPLSPDHQKDVEDILNHHPQKVEKIGVGIASIKVDYHSQHGTSKCFHVVRTDGSTTDFSYIKCVKNLVYSKFPESAQAFIEKYFA